MASHEAPDYFGRHNVRQVVKAAGLLGLAALGYLAATMAGLSLPSQNAASGSAQQSVTAKSAATVAAPSAPTARAPTRDFDYFPDQFVNQATEVAEPIATF